ncbi:DUF4398 domain-containing protein [Candidatus Poribacteria bacterium]|nr:DUF4398 domain-containing protein [Candidatus Poribacteria bacterium]
MMPETRTEARRARLRRGKGNRPYVADWLLGVLTCVWVVAGCGSSIKPLVVQQALDDAQSAFVAAGNVDAAELARQDYRQAERLLAEAVRQQQDGNQRESYYLALRTRHQSDVARAKAEEQKVRQRVDLALQGFLEARLEEASLRVETADTERQIAITYRQRAEQDARAARAEAEAANENAQATSTDSAIAIAKSRSEAEIDKAEFMLSLATETEAAVYDLQGHTETTHLVQEAKRLHGEGDYRAARLKAMDAYRVGDETRLTAMTKRDAARRQQAQSRINGATNAASEIGKAALLIEMARKAGAPLHAKQALDEAAAAHQRATRMMETEAFSDASQAAIQAQASAEQARVTATARAEQIKLQRKKEERIAQVKDTILRVQRGKDGMDDFTRSVSARQLESVDGLVRLADKLISEDKVDLALVNAERAEALIQEAIQYVKDGQAAESDVLNQAKGIENVQAFATGRGVVLRVTGDAFPVSRSDLSKEYLPVVTKIVQVVRPYAARYGIAVEGHTDRSGNADTNLRLSKARAATLARHLTEALATPSAQVSSEGYGDTQTIPDIPPTNAKNRRIEVILLTRERP